MKLVCSFHFDKCLNSGFDWLEGVVWFLLLLSICPSWTPLAKSRARRSKRHKPSTVQPTEKVIHQQEKARYGVYQGDPRGYDVSVNSRGARHSLSRSSPSLCCVAWLRLPVGHERPTAGLYSWLFGSRSSQRCGWVHGSQHPRGVRHPTSLLGDRMHLSIVEQCQGAVQLPTRLVIIILSIPSRLGLDRECPYISISVFVLCTVQNTTSHWLSPLASFPLQQQYIAPTE